MLWLLYVGIAGVLQANAPGTTTMDVSALTVGAPKTVAELDLGKLKGELRQLAWSEDGTQFYMQTTEQRNKQEIRHHYLVTGAGGAVKPVDSEPDWATEYWNFKSNRYAPGNASLVIDVKQSLEKERYGTGSAGAADRSSDGGGANNINNADNISKQAQTTSNRVIRFVLLDETIGTWVDKQPTPGTTFSWGPTGALAFVDDQGRIVLLDTQKHKQRLSSTKDAVLPAWTMDGSRLAYLYKTGRNKYTLAWSELSHR